MNETHTPTPWKVTDGGSQIYAANGVGIATLRVIDEANGGKAVRDANGQFIERACNSHDKLLAALKFMADKCNNPGLAAVADEAIREAEGGK